jgi:hypothetical protein
MIMGSNEEVWRHAQDKLEEVQIKRWKDASVRELKTPQGHTTRRIPRKNWRKTIEKEAEIMEETWRSRQQLETSLYSLVEDQLFKVG